MTVHVGIDPGMSGAIAILVDGELLEVVDMPTIPAIVNGKKRRHLDPQGVEQVLRSAVHHDRDSTPVLVVEKPQPRHSDSSHGAFASGTSWGMLLEIMRNTGWVTSIVRPQVWKKHYGLSADKVEAVEYAAAKFPPVSDLFYGPKGGAKDGRAEAALIAAFGREWAS